MSNHELLDHIHNIRRSMNYIVIDILSFNDKADNSYNTYKELEGNLYESLKLLEYNLNSKL